MCCSLAPQIWKLWRCHCPSVRCHRTEVTRIQYILSVDELLCILQNPTHTQPMGSPSWLWYESNGSWRPPVNQQVGKDTALRSGILHLCALKPVTCFLGPGSTFWTVECWTDYRTVLSLSRSPGLDIFFFVEWTNKRRNWYYGRLLAHIHV